MASQHFQYLQGIKSMIQDLMSHSLTYPPRSDCEFPFSTATHFIVNSLKVFGVRP